MIIKSRSIFTNLVIQYVFIIIFFSIIFFFIAYFIIKTSFISNSEYNLKSNALLIEEIIKPDLINKQYNKIQEKIETLDKKINTGITILNTDGYPIIFSREDNKKLYNQHTIRPEVAELLEKGLKTAKRTEFYKDLNKRILFYVYSVDSDIKTIGFIGVSREINDVTFIIDGYRAHIIFLSLFLLLCTVLIAFFMSRQVARPIKELSIAAKKVSSGNFKVRLYLNNNFEIRSLADNFNNMTMKIDELFRELNYEKEELKSIISSTKDGIIVTDNHGRIVRANNSFLDIIEEKSVINKYYWEIIRDSEIIHFIKYESAEKNNMVKQIYIKNKVILCSINYLYNKKGFVLIFYDITKLKNIENIKKDFISNVSHELRTPLTLIKGFAETLIEEENNEEKIRYLKIINRHTERLINIVKDLLLLSELEKGSETINGFEHFNMEKIDLTVLIENILSMFEEKFREKQLTLEFRILDNINCIEGDSFKLEQMFINLIDNAIKYTDKGSIKIFISEDKEFADKNDDNKVKIEIIDTGIGIPEKDLSRLFERFYVVDKSRTKKTGGTGLGLSIVKHVVMLHNGEISISSKVNCGSVFTILLPKKINFNTTFTYG